MQNLTDFFMPNYTQEFNLQPDSMKEASLAKCYFCLKELKNIKDEE